MKDLTAYAFKGSLATAFVLGLLQPFDIDKLEEGRLWFILGQSLCTFFCVWISGWLSHKCFPKMTSYQGSSFGPLALRMAPAFIFATFLLTAVLLLFNGWFNTGSMWCYWFMDGHFTPISYFQFLPLVSMVSVVIFVGMLFVERSKGLSDELEEMRELNRLLEAQHEKQAEEESPVTEYEAQKCILESSTNNLSLEVAPKDIIYIESMANYADVCYLEAGETRHKTLRITMKQLRESLASAECLVSCHRAFIVNIHFIVSISTRPTGGYQLQIFGQETQIPVARSYTDEIRQRLSDR